MQVPTKNVSASSGTVDALHPDNKARALKFIDSIVEKTCALVCPNDADGLKSMYLQGSGSGAAEEDGLMGTVAAVANALPFHCNQRKVLLAVACASQKNRAAMQQHIFVGRDLWHTSITNCSFLLHGHELKTAPMTQQRYAKLVVEDAVRYLLEHTQQESWGSTDYHMVNLTTPVLTAAGVPLWKEGDSKKINVPCLRRESGLNAT